MRGNQQSLGTAVSSFDFTVTDIEYVIDRPPDPGWRIADFVNRRSHILAYAVSGRAHYRIIGEAYPIQTGALIFMPKGTEHTASSDPDDPWHFISAAFEVSATSNDPIEQLRVLPAVSHEVAAGLSGIFHEIFAAWNAKEPGYLIQIRGTLLTILYRIVREHSLPILRQPHTRRIAVITQTLLEDYASTYSVEELADMAGLSPSHFRLMFKKVTGMTATAYQQHIKITKATEFLSSGEYNVTETARVCGFRDVYYFSRLYKKLTGINPSVLSKR